MLSSRNRNLIESGSKGGKWNRPLAGLLSAGDFRFWLASLDPLNRNRAAHQLDRTHFLARRGERQILIRLHRTTVQSFAYICTIEMISTSVRHLAGLFLPAIRSIVRRETFTPFVTEPPGQTSFRVWYLHQTIREVPTSAYPPVSGLRVSNCHKHLIATLSTSDNDKAMSALLNKLSVLTYNMSRM